MAERNDQPDNLRDFAAFRSRAEQRAQPDAWIDIEQIAETLGADIVDTIDFNTGDILLRKLLLMGAGLIIDDLEGQEGDHQGVVVPTLAFSPRERTLVYDDRIEEHPTILRNIFAHEVGFNSVRIHGGDSHYEKSLAINSEGRSNLVKTPREDSLRAGEYGLGLHEKDAIKKVHTPTLHVLPMEE